jgi:hypothetical protein
MAAALSNRISTSGSATGPAERDPLAGHVDREAPRARPSQ